MKIVFTTTFCLILNFSFSQQIIIQDTTCNYEYLVSKSATNSLYLTQFLNQYSKDTKVGDPYFRYKIGVNISITRKDNHQIQVFCSVIKESVQGNTEYNGFDFSAALFPNRFAAKINLQINGKQYQYPIEGQILNKQTIFPPILINDSTSNSLKSQLVDVRTSFDASWHQETQIQMQAVDLYQKADSLILSWDSAIQYINLEKTELIPLLDFELDEIIMNIHQFNDLNLVNRLNLAKNDPKEIAKKITEINIKASQKQVMLNNYLMNIDQQFILEARKNKDNGNILKSIHLYNKALSYHAFNITALNELAKLYYEIGNLESSGELIKTIFSKTYPDDFQYLKCKETGDLLYKKIVNQGNDMLVAQNYGEALKIFEKAYIFCDSINEPICNSAHEKGVIAAKTGIYNSYLTVISKALQNNMIDMAENYIREASKYQKLNKKEIPNDFEIQDKVNIIVSRNVEKSNTFLVSKQYLKALTYLEKADSIGRSYRENFTLACLTDQRFKAAKGGFEEYISIINKYTEQNDRYLAQQYLEKAIDFRSKYHDYIIDTTLLTSAVKNIKMLDYKNAIQVGNQLYNMSLFQNALDKYIDAKQLQVQYHLELGQNIDSLVFRLSRPLMLDYLSSTRQKIWGNDFSGANSLLLKADSLAKNANLINDSLVKNEIKTTKALLEIQQCIYLTNKNNYFLSKFNFAKLSKNYLSATQCIDSMNVIAEMAPQCAISSQISKKEIENIRNANNYQLMVNDSRYLATINQVNQALELFFKADSVFEKSNLQSFSINRDSLPNVFLFTSNNLSLLEACKWLSSNRKFKEGVSILKLMKQKGMLSKETKSYQIIFAKELYKIDFVKYPSITKKELLKQYQVDGSWFYFFRKSYLKNPITSLF
ncbi:MAG: hypothetical protein WCP69_05030 [Bacteroidota bacterium]